MASLQYLKKNNKISKNKKSKSPKLQQNPFKKGVSVRLFIQNPKKPNSGNRKIVRVRLSNGLFVNCLIPGEGNNLQEFSIVLVKGAQVRDLCGVNYKVVRGKYDLLGVANRKTSRSKYGVRKS